MAGRSGSRTATVPLFETAESDLAREAEFF
jgi:hypothetical protein